MSLYRISLSHDSSSGFSTYTVTSPSGEVVASCSVVPRDPDCWWAVREARYLAMKHVVSLGIDPRTVTFQHSGPAANRHMEAEASMEANALAEAALLND